MGSATNGGLTKKQQNQQRQYKTKTTHRTTTTKRDKWGVGINGVTANLFSDRWTCRVLPLTDVYLPKSTSADLSPQSVKCCCYFCSGPTTPNPPTNIIPTKIAWLKLFRTFPMGLGIPPLKLKSTVESNPLKSIMLVQRLTSVDPICRQPGGGKLTNIDHCVDPICRQPGGLVMVSTEIDRSVDPICRQPRGG